MVPLLISLLEPTSVVDVGCGTGEWLQVFRAHGVEDVFGIDGAHVDQNQLCIPLERFFACDLAEPFGFQRTFDLGLSLEAAHYVPKENAAGLVASIAALAPTVLFSAAIPNQEDEEGAPDLNRQWPAYWSGLFADQGFRAWDWLRPRVWEDERVDWWYSQNAVLYVREDRWRELDVADARPPMPLVHPLHFRDWVQRD